MLSPKLYGPAEPFIGPLPVGLDKLRDLVAVRSPVLHKLSDSCNFGQDSKPCDLCAAARMAKIRGSVLNTLTTRERALSRLDVRREGVDLGLSNPAYLAANRLGFIALAPARGIPFKSYDPLKPNMALAGANPALLRSLGDLGEHPQQLTMRCSPSRVRVTFSDAVSDHLSPARGASGVVRGSIVTLSEESRSRLADTAFSLTELGKEPAFMMTFTAPANWEQIYLYNQDGEHINGGRLFKEQMYIFRKRLARMLESEFEMSFKCLWFLEFQKRGAPHIHLMFFDMTMTKELEERLKEWAGVTWANIVGNPSEYEYKKHERVCSRVERMRVKHFGYAVKYATKTEQKIVPEEFVNVGRFWGLWNYKIPKNDVIQVDYSHKKESDVKMIKQMMWGAIATIAEVAPDFAAKTIAKVERTIRGGIKYKYGFTVFGAAAVKAIYDAFGIVQVV